MSVTLKNPHSILEVLKVRPKDVMELSLPSQKNDYWDAVEAEAKKNKVAIHKGEVGAKVRERNAVTKEKLFEAPESGYGLWLALDCLQDPQNLGAIFRTAAFFGVRGILMTRDRSAPMTGTVYDVASGGVEYVPYASESNLAQVLGYAKENSIWILGSSEHAKKSFREFTLDRNWCLVIGNEETGMRRLTQDICDELCTIPSKGPTTSLNASVAAGVLVSNFVKY